LEPNVGFLWGELFCFVFETASTYVSQAGIELTILPVSAFCVLGLQECTIKVHLLISFLNAPIQLIIASRVAVGMEKQTLFCKDMEV
jgi:hypothetical protein